MANIKDEILTVTQFNVETQETIIRDLTAEEIAIIESQNAEIKAQQTAKEAKAASRESALAKLAALGLTADEIGAL